MGSYKPFEANKFAVILGSNLKFCRLSKEKFMPAKVLASHLNVTNQQIQKYEAGRNIPSAFRLMQIASFYNVPIDEIVKPDFIYHKTKHNREPINENNNS